MRSFETVICANFGDPRSRDCELKHKKTAILGFKSYLFACNSKTTRRAKLKLGHNVGAHECFMQTKF